MMTSPKPKARKVAWVVLGMVVVGVAFCIASVWDTVWLKFAYRPSGSYVIKVGDRPAVPDYITALRRRVPPGEAVWCVDLRGLEGVVWAEPELRVPENAHSLTTHALRRGWLPQPRRLCVFYDESGSEVFRQPIDVVHSADWHSSK